MIEVVHDRAYIVRMEDVAVFRRNRTALRPDGGTRSNRNGGGQDIRRRVATDFSMTATMMFPGQQGNSDAPLDTDENNDTEAERPNDNTVPVADCGDQTISSEDAEVDSGRQATHQTSRDDGIQDKVSRYGRPLKPRHE